MVDAASPSPPPSISSPPQCHPDPPPPFPTIIFTPARRRTGWAISDYISSPSPIHSAKELLTFFFFILVSPSSSFLRPQKPEAASSGGSGGGVPQGASILRWRRECGRRDYVGSTYVGHVLLSTTIVFMFYKNYYEYLIVRLFNDFPD